jgi:hypothetical protein
MGRVEASTATTATTPPADPAEAVSEAATGASAPTRPSPDAGIPADGEIPGSGDPANGGERDESGRYLSREAASYRRRLREAEGERDQLRTRLEGYERAEVERIAGDARLQVPGDVWTFGATLDTLRGEDGGIDPEAVSGLVGEIVKDRPGLQARPVGDLGIGRGAAAAGTTRTPEVGLSALLKPERR